MTSGTIKPLRTSGLYHLLILIAICSIEYAEQSEISFDEILATANRKWSDTNCSAPADNNLKHYNPDSKYFLFFEQMTPYLLLTIYNRERHASCESHGLISAEMRHYDDFLSLQAQLKNFAINSYSHYIFPIGLRTNSSRPNDFTQWKYWNGDNVTFQMYGMEKPDYMHKFCAEAISILNVPGIPTAYIYYRTAFCNDPGRHYKTVQICQFPIGHPCYSKSAEEKANAERNKQLVVVGATEKRKYYFTPQQKTMQEALDFCDSNGYNLFDLNSKQQIQDFEKIHDENLNKYELGYWARFWTSATQIILLNNFQKGWVWQSTNQSFDGYASSEWSRYFTIYTDNEPSNALVMVEAKCVHALIEDQRFIKAMDPKLVFEQTLCDVPNFFYCYEDGEKRPKSKKVPSDGPSKKKATDGSSEEDDTDGSSESDSTEGSSEEDTKKGSKDGGSKKKHKKDGSNGKHTTQINYQYVKMGRKMQNKGSKDEAEKQPT